MSDLDDLKREFLAEQENELKHYGVAGMRWGKHGQAANYSGQQAKRDAQVYGTRGAKRVNKSLHSGNSISVARGDEKTRRDNIMGKNKYVRQVGKLGGGALGAGIGFATMRGIGKLTASTQGQAVTRKLLGQYADLAIHASNSLPVQAAVAAGAAKVGHMLSGDVAVGLNMRAHGYDPNRK